MEKLQLELIYRKNRLEEFKEKEKERQEELESREKLEKKVEERRMEKVFEDKQNVEIKKTGIYCRLCLLNFCFKEDLADHNKWSCLDEERNMSNNEKQKNMET